MNQGNTFSRYSVRGLGLLTALLLSMPVVAADIKIMKSGLGSGTVVSVPAGINCGTTCDASFADSATIDLTATADSGSVFVGWSIDPDAEAGSTPDCSGSGACTNLDMNVDRAIRPVFDLVAGTIPAFPRPTSGGAVQGYPPELIDMYLTANTDVDSAARFINALPDEFKSNWILMSRSESLQTGTAEFPRVLLSSGDAKAVFTLGLDSHSGYPGSHPDAIEYMQWDQTEKNFRFHEIVVRDIGPLDPDGDGVGVIPMRSRGVFPDEPRCAMCHSTRNVLNEGTTAGTDDVVKAKNKPNWDTYDSWGGMLPFNRDRIFQGSVEAAAVRKIFNPWTWRNDSFVRSIVEQLKLQPPGASASHSITRFQGGSDDGHVKFRFDPAAPVTTEPLPAGTSTTQVDYNLDRTIVPTNDPTGTTVQQDGQSVLLQNPQTLSTGEGRGVELFDILSGQLGDLNGARIADELIDHTYATGSHRIDVRPVALAISKTPQCIQVNSGTNTAESISGAAALNAGALAFFDARHGMSINELVEDTRERAESLTIRKADIQKLNLDRSGDIYLDSSDTSTGGLIQQYGSGTSQGTDTTKTRLRQEVFRRRASGSQQDATIMGGKYVDRELYGTRIDRTALYRYFLEPLGVSVDKWSMGVRGRSRTYTFADVFSRTRSAIESNLIASLSSNPFPGLATPNDCVDLVDAVNDSLALLPATNETPRYTDVQRIFNKSCIECHGNLDYPPYANYSSDVYSDTLDLSENEEPAAGEDRLDRSHAVAASRTLLYQRVTGDYSLANAAGTDTNPYGPSTDESCPNFIGLMPCGGPPLNQVDMLTLKRWMDGGSPNSRGDPHIKTVNGINYDFQAAGEYTLLKGQNLELQVRQTGVSTQNALGPNGHTGLTSCVSINTAAALKVGSHRITYQPDLSGEGQLQLRINNEPQQLAADGVQLIGGSRILPTDTNGGVRVEVAGGGFVTITPRFWSHYQVWWLHIDTNRLRARDGLAGHVANGEWLPALPNGSWLGPRPKELGDRYKQLYGVFGNAWKVTNSSSLFHYGPNESTETFTYAPWPNGESPQSCSLPPQPGIASVPPPAPVDQAEAEAACGNLTLGDARTNCVQDVMATGAVEFAAAYEVSEQIELNQSPPSPVIVSAGDDGTGTPGTVDFEWGTVVDDDDDEVTYRHCIWEVGTRPNDNDCTVIGTTGGGDPARCLLWLLLITLLTIVLLILLRKRHPGVLIVIVLVGLLLAFFGYRICSRSAPESLTTTSTGLKPATDYYWKVIAEDSDGGRNESRTEHFRTQ